MNLFLLLTAMLSALTGVGRAVDARAQAAVEASTGVVQAARAVAPAAVRRIAARPDGYVAPAPLTLDLRRALDVARAITPERRRE
ncbi:hypothetical protein [Sphingomonas sp.]|uniref:hypothetical protein n=1 Tax=Sphingomonas sp. TaxID=28214 RepID=UPI002DD6AD18|nr:hypothetical protein [Sphingomonas sp.]